MVLNILGHHWVLQMAVDKKLEGVGEVKTDLSHSKIKMITPAFGIKVREKEEQVELVCEVVVCCCCVGDKTDS